MALHSDIVCGAEKSAASANIGSASVGSANAASCSEIGDENRRRGRVTARGARISELRRWPSISRSSASWRPSRPRGRSSALRAAARCTTTARTQRNYRPRAPRPECWRRAHCGVGDLHRGHRARQVRITLPTTHKTATLIIEPSVPGERFRGRSEQRARRSRRRRRCCRSADCSSRSPRRRPKRAGRASQTATLSLAHPPRAPLPSRRAAGAKSGAHASPLAAAAERFRRASATAAAARRRRRPRRRRRRRRQPVDLLGVERLAPSASSAAAPLRASWAAALAHGALRRRLPRADRGGESQAPYAGSTRTALLASERRAAATLARRLPVSPFRRSVRTSSALCQGVPRRPSLRWLPCCHAFHKECIDAAWSGT